MRVHHKQVLVHYTNYDPKWDEWLVMSDPRIAKYQKFSQYRKNDN